MRVPTIIISYACKYNYLTEFDGRMTLLTVEAIKAATALENGNNRWSLANELSQELTAKSNDDNC